MCVCVCARARACACRGGRACSRIMQVCCRQTARTYVHTRTHARAHTHTHTHTYTHSTNSRYRHTVWRRDIPLLHLCTPARARAHTHTHTHTHMHECMHAPSPTLLPTDPVPRGQLWPTGSVGAGHRVSRPRGTGSVGESVGEGTSFFGRGGMERNGRCTLPLATCHLHIETLAMSL